MNNFLLYWSQFGVLYSKAKNIIATNSNCSFEELRFVSEQKQTFSLKSSNARSISHIFQFLLCNLRKSYIFSEYWLLEMFNDSKLLRLLWWYNRQVYKVDLQQFPDYCFFPTAGINNDRKGKNGEVLFWLPAL